MNKLKKAILSSAKLSAVFSKVLGTQKKVEIPETDEKYFEKLAADGFWTNTLETAVPIYQIYHHVHDFFDCCKITDEGAISPDGKRRKMLFLGFDGMRADAVRFVLPSKAGGKPAYNSKSNTSAIAKVSEKGGVYIAFCGGETNKDNQQTTSTSAGWTSQFTGVWELQNGIKTNNDIKNMSFKTFMLEYAKKGLHTSLGFCWDPYFDTNLKKEVSYALGRKLPMVFCDTDRAKQTYGETTPEALFLTPDEPYIGDPGLRDHAADRIESGDDIVTAIFDNIDGQGHAARFGISGEYKGAVINCDLYANSILNLIEEREKNNNEEWLVVFASDHGGKGFGHGSQTPEERTTWIATNIPFDEKYYSSSYDGFVLK